MSYLRDVYKKRGTWWGDSSKDQYINIAKKYFEDYLLRSPGASTVIINNLPIAAAVHDVKTSINSISKLMKHFLFSLEVPIPIGTLIEWDDDDWLVLDKEQRSFEAYNKALAVRCNHTLKWIDPYGILQETPAYVFGEMDKQAEDNFKMANGLLVIPGPNKNLQVVLPYYPIKSEQRFIIKGEAWRVLERDLVSIEGLLYMSLREDLVDTFDDDVDSSVADIGKLNNSVIDLGLSSMNLEIGKSFTFNPLLYQDNQLISGSTFTYTLTQTPTIGTTPCATIDGNVITAVSEGTAVVTVSLDNQPDLTASCSITLVASTEDKIVLQLVGDESIKWGRTRTYTVLYSAGGAPAEIEATFSILEEISSLITFTTTATSCSILANSDGLSGTFTLRATTAYGHVDKIISVVSVW